MDIATLRGRLPGMTRAAFGERFTLLPKKAGKMASGPDPDRVTLTDVAGRFDMSPDLEQMGGGRERPDVARVASDHASASFDLAALAWVPRQDDEIERVNPVTSALERYRVSHTSTPIPGVLLAFLSRLS